MRSDTLQVRHLTVPVVTQRLQSFSDVYYLPTADWTEVAVADVIPVTIARLGNRVMFGEDLGRFQVLVLHLIQVMVIKCANSASLCEREKRETYRELRGFHKRLDYISLFYPCFPVVVQGVSCDWN